MSNLGTRRKEIEVALSRKAGIKATKQQVVRLRKQAKQQVDDEAAQKL